MERSSSQVHIAVAAGTASTKYAFNGFDNAMRIKRLTLVPHVTSAANATNYATVTATANSATIGTATTATVPLTAGSPRDITLSGDVTVAAGGLLTLALTHSGTGVTVDFDVEIQWESIR